MVTATSITNNVNLAEPMHLDFSDSIANTEIRPCVQWSSITRNLNGRELQKLPFQKATVVAYER